MDNILAFMLLSLNFLFNSSIFFSSSSESSSEFMSLNVPKCPVYVKGYEIIKNLKIFSNLAYCRLSLPFAILFRWLKLNSPCGGVVEWFKALVLKTSVSARAPWVRIPPPPFWIIAKLAVINNCRYCFNRSSKRK